MRLTPQEPVIPERGGFTENNDLFGYRDFADRLANLVGNIDEPLVIVLDGRWGSGKSVFIKQWTGLLRARGAPVIYFDAFVNDHYEDAFLAISAEIHATAKRLLAGEDGIKRRYLARAKKAGMVLTPIALRVGARVLTAGVLSLEDLDAGSEAMKAAAKTIGDETEKALEQAVSERLRMASEERATLQAFRETLSQLATVLSERQAREGETYPLVFVVDELDRCRPTFAIGMIERIKHLFSVPGVCFVLVTHLAEFGSAVQRAYGVSNGQAYLEKFYQLRVLLPDMRNQQRTKPSAYVAHLWSALQITFPGFDEVACKDIQALADAHELPLRRVERVLTHVAILAAATGDGKRLLVVPLAAGLCVMRQQDPRLYNRARSGDLSWNDARGFLQPEGRGVQDPDSVNWWKFATGEIASQVATGEVTSQEADQKRMLLRSYGVRTERVLLPSMARYIDDLVPTKQA